jgi:hypothetical protein
MKRVLGVLLMCLPGCAYRQESLVVDRERFPLFSAEERARIDDLSFPLQVEPEKLLSTENQLVLTYLTSLSQDALCDMYHTSMEYWGWEEDAVVRAPESCLLFSKPSKVCSVLMRPEGLQTRVTLFTSRKKRRT